MGSGQTGEKSGTGSNRQPRILHVRDGPLVRERHLSRLAPKGVDGEVAPDQDEPGGGIARRTVRRPGLERPQAGVLHRLLGCIEVAEIAHQGRQRSRPRGSERRFDPVEIAYVPPNCTSRSPPGSEVEIQTATIALRREPPEFEIAYCRLQTGADGL